MAKPMKTYLVTSPEDTTTAKLVNSSREVANVSIGIFSNGEWFATLSTETDPIKAAKAAKGTNKYIVRSTLGTVTEVPYAPEVTYSSTISMPVAEWLLEQVAASAKVAA